MENGQNHSTIDSIAIENALLKNNVLIFERMDKAIEANGAKITKAVNDKTDNFIGELTKLSKNQGTDAGRITVVENKLTGIWAKIAALTSVVGIIMGLIGFLLGGGHLGTH